MTEGYELGGFKKVFTVEPSRNDSSANFQCNDLDSGPKVSPKVGVTDQKSELQPGRSDPQDPNRIAQKRAPNEA